MQGVGRVLFLSTQMEAGGVQIRATSMLKALQAEGTPAALVFLYRKRGVFDGLPGVTCMLDHSPRTPFDMLLILYRLYKFVRAYKPAAIVGFAHYSSPIAALIGVLLGVPNRVGTQTNPPNSYNFAGRMLDWICGTFGAYTANIATSKSIEACFKSYPAKYRSTLRTVYNGIHERRSLLSTRQARALFGLDEDAFLLINCGRLSDQKNQGFLLEIVEHLPSTKLAILGEGELRPDLERQIVERGIEDRVTLVGEVDPARVPDFLRCGDLFLFPSKFEAFGLAVVEAMMAGLPVLSSDYVALTEVLGDAGKLLPINDSEGWRSMIASLQDDVAAREKLGAKAIERAREFSFDNMLTGFKEAMFAQQPSVKRPQLA